jgi:Mg2+/Co2+ transporter CorC
VPALTEIEDFNAQFGTEFPDDEFDTIGGMASATCRGAARSTPTAVTHFASSRPTAAVSTRCS